MCELKQMNFPNQGQLHMGYNLHPFNFRNIASNFVYHNIASMICMISVFVTMFHQYSLKNCFAGLWPVGILATGGRR